MLSCKNTKLTLVEMKIFSLMQALNIIENTSVFITWEAHKASSIFRIREQKEYIRPSARWNFHHSRQETHVFTSQHERKNEHMPWNYETVVEFPRNLSSCDWAKCLKPGILMRAHWWGESVWDACGKERLQAERGQGELLREQVRLLCCWEQWATRAPLKGTTVENRDYLKKMRIPWYHAFITGWCFWALGQSGNRESSFWRRGSKTGLQEKPWVGNLSFSCVFCNSLPLS